MSIASYIVRLSLLESTALAASTNDMYISCAGQSVTHAYLPVVAESPSSALIKYKWKAILFLSTPYTKTLKTT